jgi:phage-related protein
MSNNGYSYTKHLNKNDEYDDYDEYDDDNEFEYDENGNVREGFIFKKIKKGIQKTNNSIKDGMLKGVSKIIDPVKKTLGDPKKLFGPLIKPLEDTANNIFKDMTKGFDFLEDLFEDMIKIFEDLGKMILDGLKKGFAALTEWAESIFDEMMKGFKEIGEFFKTLFKAIKDGIKEVLDEINGFFQSLIDTLVNSFNSLINEVCKFFNNIGDTVTDGFNKAIGSMEKGFYDVLKWFKILFKKLEEIGKFFRKLLYYIRCGIKMIINFPKCVFIYVIDAIINLFMVVIWLISYMFQFEKQWLKFKKNSLDKYIKWPNNLTNTCFRCKNKKEEKEESAYDDIISHFMNTFQNMSWLSFGMFLFSILVMLYAVYIAHYYIGKNEGPMMMNNG